MKIYLDNCASTQVSPEAANAMYFALTEEYANPSALHTAGQEAERLVKKARNQLAFTLVTKPSNIIFTSGGTEANNLALFSSFYSGAPGEDGVREGKLLISAAEHPSVYAAADILSSRGVSVEVIPVFGAKSDYPGMVDISALREKLSGDVDLVSVQHVNNEIGVIQPIDEISRIITLYNKEHSARIRLHVDAAQSYGKLAIDTENGGFRKVDLISMSAHKLHGPKGIGALFAAAPEKLHPMIFGGGQEQGIRSGTENVPGIAGFGIAARAAITDIVGNAKQANACRRRLLEGILTNVGGAHINSPEDATVTGKSGCCSPYILSVGFPGTRGEVLVHELEKSGIFVSTGAACNTIGGEDKKGRDTLTAIGLDPDAREGTLRFGFSRLNKSEEIDFVLNRLQKAVDNQRRIGMR